LRQGFAKVELPALGLAAALLFFYPLVGASTGFVATLIVAGLIAGRCGLWRRSAAALPNVGLAAAWPTTDR
jgi:hypothetical protein